MGSEISYLHPNATEWGEGDSGHASYDGGDDGIYEVEEMEEVVEMTEEELLRLLEQEQDSLTVCKSLFFPLEDDELRKLCSGMKVLGRDVIAHMQEYGIVVLDGVMDASTASELKSEGVHRAGMKQLVSVPCPVMQDELCLVAMAFSKHDVPDFPRRNRVA